MDTENMIEVTGVDLRALVREAYALSQPQGMGHLHYTSGPLPDDDVEHILAEGSQRHPVRMDYVKGRACKFSITRDDDSRLWINNRWFDHSEAALEELLRRVGLADAVTKVDTSGDPA